MSQALERIQAYKRRVKLTFRTEAGKALINDLKLAHCGNLKGDTPEDTYYNLGARDVVQGWIEILEEPGDE